MGINPIFEDRKRRIINKEEIISFSSYSAYHLIKITARAKGEKQLPFGSTDDEDLFVGIDGKSFPKLENQNILVDPPAAFSGGRLQGLAKTVYFLTFLRGKDHKIVLKADTPPRTATLENLEVNTLNFDQQLDLVVDDRAESGNQRPWLTFVLDGLFLSSFTTTISYSRRKGDSDDIKVIVDSQVQGNLLGSIKHRFWRFVGSLLKLSDTKTVAELFKVGLPSRLHYIEFYADRTPVLNKISFDLGEKPSFPSGVPTVKNPKWTEDFYEDTEEVLLARAVYGEVGGESDEAKIAVAWAIRNRIEDYSNRWGRTYHEVILKPYQFSPFLNPKSHNFKKITNPPLNDLKEKKAWEMSFKAAEDVVLSGIPDPTRGANHFYSTIIPKPDWADERKFMVQIGITRFYRL